VGEERKAENRAADSESLLLPFAVTGQVTVWDPTHRTLEIGPRAFAVARNASVADLAAGVHVTVAGYMERPPARLGLPLDRDPARARLSSGPSATRLHAPTHRSPHDDWGAGAGDGPRHLGAAATRG
jgi:hypothetical protein